MLRKTSKYRSALLVLICCAAPFAVAVFAGAEQDGAEKKRVRVYKTVECEDGSSDCAEERVIEKRVIIHRDGEDHEHGEHVWVGHEGHAHGEHGMHHVRHRQSFLGVMVAEIETEGGDAPASGVRVARVIEGSPAAEAGIQKGDVVTAIDGETVASPRDLVRSVGAREAGETISLELLRDGRLETVTATLGEPRDHGIRMRKVKKVILDCEDGEDCAPGEDFDLELDFDCDAETCEVEVKCDAGDCACTVNGEVVDCAEILGEEE